MNGDPPPLQLGQVVKHLAGRAVLTDVSMLCPPGTITALLGPNGAGKTTTLSIATGLRRPDSGHATVFGHPATGTEARRHFSLVPQEVGFPLTVTVTQLLRFVAGQRPPSSLAPDPDATLDALGLDPFRRRAIGALSGGQRRRLAVAAGLSRVPGLLLMDEATSSLDEQGRTTVWTLARDYARRGGTVLATSHILADIETHADRVIAMSAGRVVLEQPIEQVHRLLGGSSLSVRVASEAADNLRARAAPYGEWVEFTPGPDTTLLRWRTHRPVQLAALIAQAEPRARELTVGPIPLSELLSRLDREHPNRSGQHRAPVTIP